MKRFMVLFLVFCATIAFEAATAKADILITPLRVVFEGRDRSKVVTLINTTNETKTYRLGWKLLKMNDDGGYDNVESFVDANGVDRAADDMIRFSPRQVTLEPQGRQRIRLSLRRPAELTPGEYRAHLEIERLQMAVNPNAGQRGASITMQLNLGFSIPVIVRQDKQIPNITIENPRFTTYTSRSGVSKPQLEVRLNNNNSIYSSYGHLRAIWHPANGSPREVGLLNNVAVYPEKDTRTVAMDLKEVNLNSGRLQVLYEGDDEYQGTIFDNKAFPLQ